MKTYEPSGLHLVTVDFGGVSREGCLDYIPEAQVGQYCLIHMGFELSVWTRISRR